MSFISYAGLIKGAEKSTRKVETLQQLKRLTQLITVNYQTPTQALRALRYSIYAASKSRRSVRGE
jgi:hypothetical protein